MVPLADDDELVPGFLAKAIELATLNPEVIAVVGARAVIKNGTLIAEWDSRRSTGLVTPKVNVTELLQYGHHITWSAILWRTSEIQSLALFKRAATYGLPSDVYFEFSAFMSGPVYVQPLPAATFNASPGQASNTIGLNPDSIRDLGALADAILREMVESGFMLAKEEAKKLVSVAAQRWAQLIKRNRESAMAAGQQLDLDGSFAEYVRCLVPYIGLRSFPFVAEMAAPNSAPATLILPSKEFIEPIKRRISLDGRFIDTYPPGHFYSPIPSWPQERRSLDKSRPVKSVDLRVDDQLDRLHHFAMYAADIPRSWDLNVSSSLRYSFHNGYFSYGDAVAYYCFLRELKPKRVVEIGSGWSSALLLDVNEIFLDRQVSATFIDPDTTRLKPLVRPGDRVSIIAAEVQKQPIALFKTLKKGDILFVDSSHVGKYGSDLLFILFEILPELSPGVVVHFHDIPWPFEYPDIWFEKGRAWNEAYMVRALLQDSTTWKICFFNSFLESEYPQEYCESLPLALKLPMYPETIGNSSLWLERL